MSFRQCDYAKYLDGLIGCGVAFACFFYPDSQLPVLVIEEDKPKSISSPVELNTQKGFVFAPFNTDKESPLLLFSLQQKYVGYDIAHCLPKDLSPFLTDTSEASTSKEEYLMAYDSFMRQLHDGHLTKLVLSRKHVVDRRGESIGELFIKAHESYPSTFTYIVNAQECGLWFGATPELLLKGTNGDFETVALAGTMPVTASSENYDWDEKDSEEQQMVVDFITEKLLSSNVTNLKAMGPFTSPAGAVVHLKTKFNFSLPIGGELGTLLESLHPTPAVCGTPKAEALDQILNTEPHRRDYYTGFVGVLDNECETNIYVNLRCMKVTQNQLVLYAGGGITSKSEGEKEWVETTHKLRTLLSIIEE